MFVDVIKFLDRLSWGTSFKYAFICICGSISLAISAQVAIPFYPVPVTMQSFMVVLIGAICGYRLGFATIMLYLLEGVIGIPVFADGGFGIMYLIGPTGGYLVSFVLACTLAGYLTNTILARNLLGALSISLFCATIILVIGTIYLSISIGIYSQWKSFCPFISLQ